MKKLVFRIPATALLAAGLIAICVTPVAWVAPGLQVLYVLPLAYAYWVLRNRTTVTEERIVARGVFGTTTLEWSEVRSIRLVQKGWLRAVRQDASEVVLPAVRFMHLPALSVVSGGRVPDPTVAEEEPEEVTDEVTGDVNGDSGGDAVEEAPGKSVQSEK
ncbi:PH domain-containing protein [Lentzea sp. DG1S-22]|uniref:PH domain-containing protein n=1 Tax=Lentzea sp. DG1S-22 TaxID=3108822 RepID=UPI002E79D6CD|nr:PH domain-containing protein [Lentzea sp. DG1S-22]WVH80152.1 PH domain-containing protein [Lentzea sp. DG1S-22]